MELISRRAIYSTTSIFILALVLYLLPVNVPQTLSLRGAVAAAKEWVLLRSDNGQFVSQLRCNRTGVIEQCSITQIERGDALSFMLSDRLRNGSIARGDTVGWLISSTLMQQISTMEGALAVAEADLASARSGEKASFVEEARQRLAYARAELSAQEKLHARQSELHAKNMISDEMFDLSLDRVKQLRINTDLADASLRSALTGLKPEEIHAAEATVRSLRTQLDGLRRLMQRHTFVTPIGGALRSTWAVDTLLVIADVSEQLLIVPVRLMDMDRMRVGEAITFTVPTTGLRGSAHIESIDRTVRYYGRRPVGTITARIERCDAGVTSGMMVTCTVVTEAVPLRTYIIDAIARLFD